MKKSRLIFLVIIVIIFVIIIEIFNKNIKTKTTTTQNLESETVSSLTNETIYINNKNIFAFNETTVKLVNSDKIIWEDSLTLTNPYSIFKNGVLGISQKNSNILKVYSEVGPLYTVNLDSNIVSFSVNQNAYTSIISKNNNYYEINVYNTQGNLVFGLKNIAYSEGIPISSSISTDNKLLAVSFLNIDNINYNSNIAIYDLTKNTTESNQSTLFTAFLKENQFSGIIDFMDKSHLLVISENQVSLFKIVNNLTTEVLYLPLNNKLKFAEIIDDKTFVLVYGDPKNIESTFDTDTVVFYSTTGNKLGQYTSDKTITGLYAGQSSALIKCNRSLKAINSKGKLLWEYQVLQDLKQFSFFETTNKIITSSNNEVKITSIDKNSNQLLETNQTEDNITDPNSLNSQKNTSEDLDLEIEDPNEIKDIENIEETEKDTTTYTSSPP